MQKIREIPWFRVGAESAAIVGSILLAFTIDAWWADRSEATRTLALLQNLEVEWTGELARMDSTLDQFGEYRMAMRDIVRLVYDNRSSLTEERALELYRVVRFVTYKPSTAALDILLLNGLDQIESETLALAITSWHSVLEEPVPEQNALFELTFNGSRKVRQDIIHRLRIQIDGSPSRIGFSGYEAESGKLALALLTDDEHLRAMRYIFDVALDYEAQLRVVRETLAENLVLLRDYLEF